MYEYTLHQKKVTFNLSIYPDAHGSLTLTDGLDDPNLRSPGIINQENVTFFW